MICSVTLWSRLVQLGWWTLKKRNEMLYCPQVTGLLLYVVVYVSVCCCVCVCLCHCLSVADYMHVSVCLLLWDLFICLRLSVRLSICLSVSVAVWYIRLPVFVAFFIALSLLCCLCVPAPVCQSVCSCLTVFTSMYKSTFTHVGWKRC